MTRVICTVCGREFFKNLAMCTGVAMRTAKTIPRSITNKGFGRGSK